MAFKSAIERTVDLQLKVSGIQYTYESLEVPYTLYGSYHPDFILANGIIIEVKGLLDRESKRKMMAVKTQRPDLDIRFVFQDANKKVPHTKETHGRWATRTGWKWAEGRIPDSWLEES